MDFPMDTIINYVGNWLQMSYGWPLKNIRIKVYWDPLLKQQNVMQQNCKQKQKWQQQGCHTDSINIRCAISLKDHHDNQLCQLHSKQQQGWLQKTPTTTTTGKTTLTWQWRKCLWFGIHNLFSDMHVLGQLQPIRCRRWQYRGLHRWHCQF